MKPSLSELARTVLDSEAFVRKLLGIAELYAREHKRDCARSQAKEMRRSLAQLSKSALAVVAWLERGARGAHGSSERIEHEAWMQVRATAVGELNAYNLKIDSADQADDFRTVGQAAAIATKAVSDKSLQVAPRFAAEALCAAFKEHGCRPTAYEKGPAVRLLVAIAESAGDNLTTRAARQRIADALRPHLGTNPPSKKRRNRA